MAKPGEVNFFVKHVEKLVLGVCLAAMLATIAIYPMAEPKVTFDGSAMPPGEVTAHLANLVDAIEKGKTPPALPPEPDYTAQLASLMNPQVPFEYLDIAGVQPPVESPEIQQNPTKFAKIKLQDLASLIPPPAKPLVAVSPELLDTDPVRDVVVAHATALYPWKELFQLWNNAMKTSVLSPTVMVWEVQAEKRVLLPDGSWSKPQTVPGASRAAREVGTGSEVVVATIPDFDGGNTQEIQSAIVQYRQNGTEQSKAEPDYWDVWGINHKWLPWQVNLPWTELSGMPTVETQGQPTIAPVPDRGAVRTTPNGHVIAPRPDSGMMNQMHGGYPAGGQPGYLTSTVAPPPVVHLTASATLETVPVPTPVPPWNTQVTSLNKFQVWMHDDSLDYLKTYRYHMRVVLLNPLYAHPGEVEPEADAKVRIFTSPWSEWSNPVSAPRQADLFLTGGSDQQKMVSISVFSRCQGQWVQHSFNVRVGDKIGQVAEVQVPDLEHPEKMIKRPWNFYTGDTLLAIDWNSTVLHGSILSKTVEIVYVDEQGNLGVRNKDLDRDSIELKKRTQEASLPQAITPKPSPTPKPVRTPRPTRVVAPTGSNSKGIPGGYRVPQYNP